MTFGESLQVSSFSTRKKALLRWGYDRLWHRWPLLLLPCISNFRREVHYFPNFLFPRTFNEKILYRMLFDRRDFLHRLTGKLECRDFVARRMGNDAILVPLIGIVRQPEDFANITLPARFIMKASHGSAMLHIHDSDAPPNQSHLQQLCRNWLAEDYGKYQHEWVYKGTEHVVLIEPLLSDPDGGTPTDYKFFCYDGLPRFIKTDSDRFGEHHSCIFDAAWNHIPGKSETRESDVPPPPPTHLQEMLAIAAKLSHGMDFVRVDLYDTSDGVRFGEMTNTPGAAMYNFDRRSLDVLFGEPWKLDLRSQPDDLSHRPTRRGASGKLAENPPWTKPIPTHDTAG
jgi:hypothetical protein